ncbi:sorbitol dehydrogenase [Mycena maculata]|uniref:Sorbitol dehydrogenase n=1 Tax=Mycena maculata TaxID=230809 RepID=A0AAD7I2B2_9AGAR|nr:sorbitol dehydrogenase [Mycena maculata]
MIAQGRGGAIIDAVYIDHFISILTNETGASSLAGKKGAGMCSVYGSSKFAVRALTQSAALEWGKHQIRVNAFAPGATDTPLLADMGVVFGNLIGAPAITYKEIAALGKIGSPEAIAGIVSFLASKDSEFMTGQTLSVDGGIWFD